MPATPAPAPLTVDFITFVDEASRLGLLDDLVERVSDKLADLIEKTDRPEPLLTIDDVADYLRVSKRTVETLIAEGELVPLRIRTRRMFTREAIDAYLRRIAGGRRN